MIKNETSIIEFNSLEIGGWEFHFTGIGLSPDKQIIKIIKG